MKENLISKDERRFLKLETVFNKFKIRLEVICIEKKLSIGYQISFDA